MNNIIALIIIVLVVAGFLWYMERESKRRDRAEKERFREFVIAVKSQKIEDYVTYVPADDVELPKDEDDELVELDQIDPETLLKAIKQNEGN